MHTLYSAICRAGAAGHFSLKPQASVRDKTHIEPAHADFFRAVCHVQFFFRSHPEMRIAQKNHQSGNINISWSEKTGNLYGRVSSACDTYAYAFHEISIQGELQSFQRMAVAPGAARVHHHLH